MSDLRFAMEELGAKLDGDLQAGHAPRPAAPADAFTRLEDQHAETFARELVSRRDAGGTRADHDDIRRLRRGAPKWRRQGAARPHRCSPSFPETATTSRQPEKPAACRCRAGRAG